MKSLLGILACLSVLVIGCGEDTKRSVGPSAAAAKVATDDSSTPAAGDDSSTPAAGDDSSTPATTSTAAVTPDSVWTSLKAGGKYTSAGSALAAFIMAAAAGDLAAVTSFVQAGIDKEGQALVNVGGIGRVRTALHAAAGGHLAVVTYLLGQGASISSTDAVGDTPLHAAVASGNLAIVKYLVGQEASVDAKNTAGETPLHYAAAYGHLLIVRYLEGQGADLTITSNDGLTPTQTADLSGQTAVNTYLAPKTARAELDSLGIAYTGAAFRDSARVGNLAVVRLFVVSGMSVNSANDWGVTVLHYAVGGGRIEVARYLIDQGADVRAKDHYGWTVLEWANEVQVSRQDRAVLLNYLVSEIIISAVKNGGDVNATNKRGETALHTAASASLLSAMQYLVGQGANLEATDNNGDTPLHYAARSNNLSAVQYLVGQGASRTAEDNDGDTPRDEAARYGHTAIVAYFDSLDDDDDE